MSEINPFATRESALGSRHWMRQHMRPSVIGVDTGSRCGFALLSVPDWEWDGMSVDGLAYVNVSDAEAFPDHIAKIVRVGKVFQLFASECGASSAAFELPVVARSPNASTILQARMFQHLVDCATGLYHRGYSEINPATSRSQVLRPGDAKKGKTKEKVVLRVEERFALDLYGLTSGMKEQRKVVEALADAVTVAMSLVARVRDVSRA